MASRVRVYMACSLDGFVAGPDDDLSWLAPPEGAPPPGPTEALEFEPFMAQVGSMLMGRRTHDVVAAMGHWPYGELPVLVATHRGVEAAAPTVRAVSGTIEELVAQARAAAGDKDVYVDGADMIRQAIDAGLVDELVITFVPILLAGGVRLFDGLVQRRRVEFVAHHDLGGMMQLTARVL